MQNRLTGIEFKGGVPRIQKQLFLVIEFTMALTCVLLMGYGWLRLYLVFAVVSLPAILFAYYALSNKNWFRFDDENKSLRVPFKPAIRYDSIRAIQISEYNGHLSISAQKGKLDRTPLVQNLTSRDKWRLLEELKKRFPEEIIHQTKLAQWKMSLGLYIAPIIPCVLLLVLTHYMTLKYPQITVMPEDLELETEFDSAQSTTEYTLGQVSFQLPQAFRLEQEKKRTLLFEDVENRTDLRVYV